MTSTRRSQPNFVAAKLPVKAETSQLLGKKTGDVVTVRLTARDRR
jgi:hypothetical protein